MRGRGSVSGFVWTLNSAHSRLSKYLDEVRIRPTQFISKLHTSDSCSWLFPFPWPVESFAVKLVFLNVMVGSEVGTHCLAPQATPAPSRMPVNPRELWGDAFLWKKRLSRSPTTPFWNDP